MYLQLEIGLKGQGRFLLVKASAVDAYDDPCTGEQDVWLLEVFDVLEPVFLLINILPFRLQIHQLDTYLEFAMILSVSIWLGLW